MTAKEREDTIRSAEDHALGAVYVEAVDRRKEVPGVWWRVRRDLMAWVSKRRKIRAAGYKVSR